MIESLLHAGFGCGLPELPYQEGALNRRSVTRATLVPAGGISPGTSFSNRQLKLHPCESTRSSKKKENRPSRGKGIRGDAPSRRRRRKVTLAVRRGDDFRHPLELRSGLDAAVRTKGKTPGRRSGRESWSVALAARLLPIGRRGHDRRNGRRVARSPAGGPARARSRGLSSRNDLRRKLGRGRIVALAVGPTLEGTDGRLRAAGMGISLMFVPVDAALRAGEIGSKAVTRGGGAICGLDSSQLSAPSMTPCGPRV
jgi:hypothetical protein